MKNTLKYIGLLLLLTIIGFLIRNFFFELSLSQIANENIQVESRNMSGQFYSHITFALSIGIIPLLYLIIKKMTKLNFFNQGIMSYGIVIVCGILLWQFRVYQLNNQALKLVRFNVGSEIKIQMGYDTLNFGRYLFFGFIIGTILSILIFKNRNNTAN
tara:strand:+ start:2761 stop:3234 length:474 start_codon:yes stop_codon:yes gene_type:complete